MSTGQDKAVIAIREAAHEWAARLEAPDLTHSDKVAFAAWLRASPIHLREYLSVEALRMTVKAAVERDTTDVHELFAEIPSNVVGLGSVASVTPPRTGLSGVKPPISAGEPSQKSGRRTLFSLALAATVLLAFGAILALFHPQLFEGNVHATRIGEIRQVRLPDGSTVELNTQSEIRVDFEAGRRDIHLARGEAFFTVARNPQRPFRVFSDAAQVQAIGTQFNVHRQPGQTVVTVVEGRVAALPLPAPRALERPASAIRPGAAQAPLAAQESASEPILLKAGDRVVIEAGQGVSVPVPEPARVDANRMTAWRQHRLIFDNEPLARVIAEFNRYNRRQLVVEDPELAAQGISGVFDPDKPEGLILFLSAKGGVQATENSDGALLLSR